MAEATLASLLGAAKARLAAGGIEDPALDARLIVEHFTDSDRLDFVRTPDRIIEAETVSAVDTALTRRLDGEPVHRILGFREFYGLKLSLAAETLEPRPDTEILVDGILPFVREVAGKQAGCRIVDLGTGTGAIALALLNEVPQASALGVDVAEGALAQARKNADDLGLGSRFSTLKSDWFSEIFGVFDLIVSNPPYIASKEIPELQVEVKRFDPMAALDGGQDGLDAYRVIAAGSSKHLAEGGRVAIEIGHTQLLEVSSVFEQEGFVLLSALKDFSGNDRALIFEQASKR
ncbi:peptide chain release factor N(5)-glutamine methyltransferase [Mesorhizobium sp. SB112]|uniref:peptide chain release factor N(5)-glutamine methyltransferase n=1 Tax=Mesorhizobium sp. SB112 TaxID=3151853 RepID=UPI003263AF50